MKKFLTVFIVLALIAAGAGAALAQEDTETNIGVTIEKLFDQYNPSAKQAYLDMKAEHETFHAEREELHLNITKEYAGAAAGIFTQISTGAITPEEGKTQFQTLQDEVNTLRSAVEDVLAPKEAEAETIQAEFQALREATKAALQQEEIVASQIAGYLEDLNGLLRRHIDMDYKYAELVDDILD